MEVSSFCNANCVYCPHTAYKDNWQNRFLPLEIFAKLIPAFAKTKLIYLQGWGEPFTNPHFFDMLTLAKNAGCMVGTTTNGTLLNTEIIERLVAEGLDIICFSLAGVDKKNDLIRKGTQLQKVLSSIEQLHRAKNKYGNDNLKINIAFMLLHSGLDDLEKLPDFLRNIGVSQTVISSLSLVVDPAMAVELALASGEKEYLELKSRLFEIRELSTKQDSGIYLHIVSPLLKPSVCSENISNAMVVGSDGSVSPCVMTRIPVKGENFYYFSGQKQRLQNLAFGNIYDESLNTIWHQKEYRQFIRTFRKGCVPNICRNCNKRFIDSLA